MKIAIASDDEIKIASHLGRAEGFIIVDIEKGKVANRVYRRNDFTVRMSGQKESGQGAGRHDSVMAALKGCQAIISHGMGRRLISDLEVAGIETYLTEETEIERVIKLYINGTLDDNWALGCKHD